MSSSDRSWLSNKDRLEAATMLEWMERADDARYLNHHRASVELIAYNFERGMSRATMVRIWGRRLVDAVIGVEVTNYIKQEEPDGTKISKPRTR